MGAEPVRAKGARGVRLNPKNSERQRAKIRTTQICKRLEQFTLDEKDEAGQKVEMTSTQVTAALGLLKKTLPDLTSVEGSLDLALTKHDESLGELE